MIPSSIALRSSLLTTALLVPSLTLFLPVRSEIGKAQESATINDREGDLGMARVRARANHTDGSLRNSVVADGMGSGLPRPNRDLIARKIAEGTPPSIVDYGCDPNGVDPCQDLIIGAIHDVYAQGICRLFVPRGNFTIDGPIVVSYPVEIFGAHKSISVIQATHFGNGFYVTGQNGTGGRIRDISVLAKGKSNDSTVAIYLYASPEGYGPDFFEVRDINISGNRTWQYGVILDGSVRPGPTPLATATPSGFASLSLPPGSYNWMLTFNGTAWATNQWVRSSPLVARQPNSGAAQIITGNTATTLGFVFSLPAGAPVPTPFNDTDPIIIESALHGIRDIKLSNIDCFQTTAQALESRQGRGIFINNFIANGANNGANFTAPSTALESYNVHVSGFMGGSLYVSNMTNFFFSGTPTYISIATTAQYGRISVSTPAASIFNSSPQTVTVN